MKKFGLLLITIVAIFLCVGCAKTSSTDTFRFATRNVDVKIGESKDLEIIKGATNDNVTVIYKLELVEGDVPAYRILSMNGVESTYCYRDTTMNDEVLSVVGIQEGTVKITAYIKDAENHVDFIIVNVIDEKLTAYQLISESNTLTVGDKVNLSTTTYPDGIKDEATYLSSDESILKVSSNGVLEAVGPGTATISATSIYDSSLTAKKEFTVNQVKVSEVTAEKSEINMYIGETYQIFANVLPSLPSTGLKYKVSDANICSVSEDGVITALRDGACTITVTAGSKSCDISVNVSGLIETALIFYEDQEFNVAVGVTKELTFYYSVIPSQASQALVIENSDETVVTVTAVDGVLTISGIGVGTAVVKVSTKSGQYFKEFNVTSQINPEDLVSSIEFAENTKTELVVGKSTTIKTTVNPTNAVLPKLSWSSSDETIATVDEKGKVTALAAGVVTITATAIDGSLVSQSVTITISLPEE